MHCCQQHLLKDPRNFGFLLSENPTVLGNTYSGGMAYSYLFFLLRDNLEQQLAKHKST